MAEAEPLHDRPTCPVNYGEVLIPKSPSNLCRHLQICETRRFDPRKTPSNIFDQLVGGGAALSPGDQ